MALSSATPHPQTSSQVSGFKPFIPFAPNTASWIVRLFPLLYHYPPPQTQAAPLQTFDARSVCPWCLFSAAFISFPALCPPATPQGSSAPRLQLLQLRRISIRGVRYRCHGNCADRWQLGTVTLSWSCISKRAERWSGCRTIRFSSAEDLFPAFQNQMSQFIWNCFRKDDMTTKMASQLPVSTPSERP